MRVGQCATLGDEAEGNRCDAPDDPEGHPEGVVEEEGVATMEWHRIGVREAGPWTRAACPKTPRPNGAAPCQPGATSRVPARTDAMSPERAAEPRRRDVNLGWTQRGFPLAIAWLEPTENVEETVFLRRGEGASDSVAHDA